MPALSVLLPVRDARPWLSASLASLWRQSHRDFEVVAVDDGSRDGSGEILEREARRERRLRVVRQEALGLPAALNAGLRVAGGDRIARHDADDWSHPERFELQTRWLDAHPEVSVVGCRVGLLPRGFRGEGMRRWVAWHNRLGTHQAMAREALVDSPLAHGTAVFRRAALLVVGGWRERGWPEDLDLWLRLLDAGHRMGKVPRTLYRWRQHERSATRRDPRYHRDAFDRLRLEALGRRMLRERCAPTLIGVGASLERWILHLTDAGFRPQPRVLGRPGPTLDFARPALLVFGSPVARARWRAALEAHGWIEGEHFAFVA